MTNFHHVLANTLIANVTTSYLWFALTFWVYLETRNVALAGVLNGTYVLLIAVGSIFFGSVVDHNRKKNVMMFAAVATFIAFTLAAGVWAGWVDPDDVSADDTALWLFAGLILLGAVVEHMRNIALSTTVTLMVPEDGRDRANGLVGAVQGVAFFVTSILSGVSIGFLGMGPTMWIALGLTVVALVHLIPVTIPEERIITAAEAQAAATEGSETEAGGVVPAAPPTTDVVSRGLDLKGSLAVIMSVPGLLALILFTSFNNLIGGVYTALMDPYGLELFSPQVWGVVLGVTSLGFIAGGALIAKTGLGRNPVRTLLLVNVGVAVLGMVFGLREWWWLYAGGILAFMLTIPAAEAAEQTILQRVVPFRQQGRVFGLAMAVEMAANPLSTFVVAILAEAYIIPWMASDAGRAAFGWLLGEGSTRGMALMFLISGAIMLVVVLLAFLSRPYRRLSEYYAGTSQDIAGAAGAAE
ncbi:MFS transporter [Corynebacterium halotolerans]|uniref:Multidrug resistance protein n=1 Tax=Corynebacterium halotolerans YIM 70093 = DSM 44683 TaxID=1121362 RepID=M1PA34_9CORY|nr:MFS transporter [Corynebacterium halotolerans]AGF73516.1 multidrug resistance protein [Corynebacterium halotolerans YIM 70093 = DSM 44683]